MNPIGNYKNNVKIDNILHEKMLQKNLTLKDLSEITGVSVIKIKYVKRALRKVNAMLFYEMLKKLDIKMEDFCMLKQNQ